MSFDRFASGLQLPNVGSGVSPRASDSSDFLRLYFKTDQLYHTDEAGTEVQLTGLGLSFDDLTDKTSGTGEYATTGYFTAGLGSGGISLTTNDGGGNASVTFNHRAQTPEQTGNAGRIRVNSDSTTGGAMEFQVGSGLTSGVAFGLTTYFTVEENLLTSNAAFNILDSKELRFGTGSDWAFQYNGTDAYMDLDSGTWRWRDGANGNAIRIQWTPDAGLEFQDGHQLQLGTSNDLQMYHSSDVNYFDMVNGDLKIRDVSGTATDRFVFTQAGNLGIGTDAPDVALSVATTDNTDTGPDKSIRLGHTGDSARSAVLTKSRNFASDKGELKLEVSKGATGSPLTFYSNVNDETMRLDENGNLGIGSSAPEAYLHVQGPGLGGTAGDAEDLVIIRDQSNTTSGNADRIVFSHERLSTGTNWETAGMRIGRRVDSSEMGYIQFGHGSDTDGDLITFGDAATELMRLTPQGKLGIGTDAPDVELHVAGGLRVGESSDFDSGTDVNKTAAIMLPEHGVIAFDTGDFIRTLISKDSSGYINVGQNGTGVISRVNLLPGSAGYVLAQSSANELFILNNNSTGNSRIKYQLGSTDKYSTGVDVADDNFTIYSEINSTTPFRIEPGSGNDEALVIDGNGDIAAANTITADEIQARVTSSGTTTGTLTASDANTKVTMTGDITVPNSTFATDDTIMFDGNGTDRTLTPASGLTIYVDGAAASSIDVGANKIIGLTFRSGTVAIATGVDATTSTTYLYSATSTDTSTNHNASFTPTIVDFDTELINQGSFTESGGRITVPIDGVYRVYGMVTYGRNSTEQRLSLQLQVFKNATATGARGRGAYVRGQSSHDHASAYIEDFVDCSSGDILDVRAFQDAITGTSVVQANQSRLLIQRIG